MGLNQNFFFFFEPRGSKNQSHKHGTIPCSYLKLADGGITVGAGAEEGRGGTGALAGGGVLGQQIALAKLELGKGPHHVAGLLAGLDHLLDQPAEDGEEGVEVGTLDLVRFHLDRALVAVERGNDRGGNVELLLDRGVLPEHHVDVGVHINLRDAPCQAANNLPGRWRWRGLQGGGGGFDGVPTTE